MNSVPLNIWIIRFKEKIVSPELNDKLIQAFLNHLADLKIFKNASSDSWELSKPIKDWDESMGLNLMKMDQQ